jgi:hypothetical protein
MTERLDRPDAVRDLPSHVHALYLGGALYARGVSECWRDDSRALECANRLDSLKLKLYEMSADQVRMNYYANRGDFVQFDRYRRRVELHAIQRGTAWQVETWTFAALLTVYLRTQDVGRLKECADQLRRISADVPTLRRAYERALAAYYVLRGTPAEALEGPADVERPMELVGWMRGEGLRARAYNAVGDHTAAREVCARALALVTPEDLAFCAMNLGVPIELARAEAGLGNFAVAEEQLRALVANYERFGNPLTMGALHEALAELAARRGDADAFAASLREVERWFRPTRIPSIVARCERLAASGPASQKRLSGAPVGRTSSSPPRLITVVHRLRHGGGDTVTGSAEWALQQLSEFAAVGEAYLFLLEGGEVSCVARIGTEDRSGVFARWVGDQLQAAGSDESVVTCTAVEGAAGGNQLEVSGATYQIAVLRTNARGGEDVVGAVVLPSDVGVPFPVLSSIAERIGSTRIEGPRTLTQRSSPG